MHAPFDVLLGFEASVTHLWINNARLALLRCLEGGCEPNRIGTREILDQTVHELSKDFG